MIIKNYDKKDYVKKKYLFLKSINDTYSIFSMIGICAAFLVSYTLFLIYYAFNSIDISSLVVGLLVTIWLVFISYFGEIFLKKIIIDRPSATTYLNTVRHELRIMGLSLYNLHSSEENKKIIIDKFISKNSRLDFINDMSIKDRKDFRFLLIDPFSTSLIFRADDENKSKYKLRLECLKTIKRFEEIIADNDVRKAIDFPDKIFEYRIYNCLPTHSAIMTDELLLVGPYLFGMSGTESKWIRFTNYKAMKQYDTEFEEIWKDKRTKNRNDISDVIRFVENISYSEIDELLDKESITDKEFDTFYSEKI